MPLPSDSGVLPEAARELLRDERATLARIRELLAPDPTAAEAVAQLRQAELDLEEPFLLVVVGEFNSGKSAFINALLGAPVLREGVTPTTAAITRLRYAATHSEQRAGPLVEVGYPLDLLRDLAYNPQRHPGPAWDANTPATQLAGRKQELFVCQ